MAKILGLTLTGKVWQFILFKFYLFKKKSNSTHFQEKYIFLNAYFILAPRKMNL